MQPGAGATFAACNTPVSSPLPTIREETPKPWYPVRPSYRKPTGGFVAIGPRYQGERVEGIRLACYSAVAGCPSGPRSSRSSTSRRVLRSRSGASGGSSELALEPMRGSGVVEPGEEHER